MDTVNAVANAVARIGLALACAVIVTLLCARPSLAGETHIFCGVVTDFRTPTTTSGTVQLGAYSSGIAVGAAVPQLTRGSRVCVTGPIDDHAQYLSYQVSAIPETLCGDLIEARDRGPALQRLQTATGTGSFFLPTTIAGPPQGASGCFRLSLDAVGNAYLAALVAAANPAPSPVSRVLPNTSSSPAVEWPPEAMVAMAGFVALGLAGVVTALTREARR
jgi:hypothetical protein